MDRAQISSAVLALQRMRGVPPSVLPSPAVLLGSQWLTLAGGVAYLGTINLVHTYTVELGNHWPAQSIL
jgi:hypothetical protein